MKRAFRKLSVYASVLLTATLSFVNERDTLGEAESPNSTKPSVAEPESNPDPHLWLEDVGGQKALDWVKLQNSESESELGHAPEFDALRKRLLSIFDSKERIPTVAKYGEYYYNFWRDEKNVRGIWRRTTLDEFRKDSPAWEVVLDLDKLSAEENENWVWHGANVLHGTYDRCLLLLSRGGADANVVREFDLKIKQFIPNGFYLAEAKSDVDWQDRDTLYVGTDFGPGSLTSSGYPRVIKEWRRNQPLSQARTVFEGAVEDVGVGASVVHDHGHKYEFLNRGRTFFTSDISIRKGDSWSRIVKPEDARLSTFNDQILLQLRSDWNVNGKVYFAGSLLATELRAYLDGGRDFEVLFTPTERSTLMAMTQTKTFLVLNELESVQHKVVLYRRDQGKWVSDLLDVSGLGTVSLAGIDPDESDDLFMTAADFLSPSTLYLITLGKPERQRLKGLPKFFDATGLEVRQFETKSRDGTLVPYFQVNRKNFPQNGNNPTLLYGYGGFEIPMLPGYNPGVGASWLERGGVYVLANIRGGGEFGPNWHNAARKQNRQRAYDDFIAIAEDLIARKVTSPQHLGIQGGSNGGLLMGVMLTQRPDLFKAVVCQVPLLDMRRFNKLLAGASWMDEYGNPDTPDEWSYIRKYSPYQNVRKDQRYPRVLFTTSTRDDRVHPGHARKMVARMKEQGHNVLYYENIEGGHGGAANNRQAAYMSALGYTFLWHELQ